MTTEKNSATPAGLQHCGFMIQWPTGQREFFDRTETAQMPTNESHILARGPTKVFIIDETVSASPAVLDVDALAQAIRRVDGNHSLGAGALAEALMPFLASPPLPQQGGEQTDTVEHTLRAMAENYGDGPHAWDWLDKQVCRKGADEIKRLRTELVAAVSPQGGEATYPRRDKFEPWVKRWAGLTNFSGASREAVWIYDDNELNDLWCAWQEGRSSLGEAKTADQLYEIIKGVLESHRLQHFRGDEGEGYPLVDQLSSGRTIDTGLEEIELICDSIYNEIIAAPAVGEEFAEIEALREMLLSPVAVHNNMLAGTIAKIDMTQLAHVHGGDTLDRWLTFQRWEQGVGGEAKVADRIADPSKTIEVKRVAQRLSDVQIDAIRNEVMQRLAIENNGVIGGPDVEYMQFPKLFAEAIMTALGSPVPGCSVCGDTGKWLAGYTGLFGGSVPVYEHCKCPAAPVAQALPVAAEKDARDVEIERLNKIINTPQSGDFLRAVSIEAEHQRQRWGIDCDSGKAPADWFWLIGYLAGKALHSLEACQMVKAEHHIITTAAACLNWHMAMLGNTNMRPGIDGDAAIAAMQGSKP